MSWSYLKLSPEINEGDGEIAVDCDLLSQFLHLRLLERDELVEAFQHACLLVDVVFTELQRSL